MKCGTEIQPQNIVEREVYFMVDTQGLGLAIVFSGKSKSSLARKMGRTYQTLCNKINNKTQFTGAEVDFLCRELNIDENTRQALFFAEKVER